MRYLSTRGAWVNDPQPFRAILLEGLAPDGGLAVPERYPRFSHEEFEALRPLVRSRAIAVGIPVAERSFEAFESLVAGVGARPVEIGREPFTRTPQRRHVGVDQIVWREPASQPRM